MYGTVCQFALICNLASLFKRHIGLIYRSCLNFYPQPNFNFTALLLLPYLHNVICIFCFARQLLENK